MSHAALDALLDENRKFPPPADFAASAHVRDRAIYARADADPEAYWASWAEELDWFEPWHTVLEWTPPHARWFDGGKLNVAHNCLDRHLDGPRRDKPALIWAGDPGETRTYTYAEQHEEVSRFANAL
jgi:acetyl-CoA synthetase